MKTNIQEIPLSNGVNRLTAGREYFVIGIDHISYRIIDDFGEPILYPKSLFSVCDTEIFGRWKFVEGDDGDYYLDPVELAAPGFYENFFASDGDLPLQASAHRAVHRVVEAMAGAASEVDRVVLMQDEERLLVHTNKRRQHGADGI